MAFRRSHTLLHRLSPAPTSFLALSSSSLLSASPASLSNQPCLSLSTHSHGPSNGEQIPNRSHRTKHTQQDTDADEHSEIAQDAERICKLLSQNPNSSVESLLYGAASVEEAPPALVVEVLKKLTNAGFLALAFFRWAENQKGFKHTADCYNSLIDALGKIKQFNVIWNLVCDMQHRGILCRETFALISRRYVRVRRVEEAVEAFEKMGKFGFKPEVSDFNRLIGTLSESKNVRKAQEVFDKMKHRRFEPDIKSYTILLEGWGRVQNLSKLKEVYKEMRDDGFGPDIVTFGIVINAHCKARMYDEAIRLFHEMRANNVRPSPHVFCILINGLGSEKRLSEALEFFEQSKLSGIAPELPTYNAVVGAYCSSMKMDDAYRTVDEMRKHGIGPNSRTYDIILRHLIKAGRSEEAYSVFQRMSSEPGCEPTVSTYAIVVKMFCNTDLDMAIWVWDQMKDEGVIPGTHMFAVLIDSLRQANRLEDACMYLEEMLDVGIRPPATTFANLKQALIDEGRKDTVQFLVEKINKLRNATLLG